VAEWIRYTRDTRLRGPQELREARTFGKTLFEALFPGELLAAFRASRSTLAPGERLRLRLRLPPALVMLPWELLYDQYSDQFLALAPDLTLVRYPEMPAASHHPGPLHIDGPLRVIAVLASPCDKDYPTLRLDRELGRLERALTLLRNRGRVQLDVIRGPGTLDQLRERLHQPAHILHILSHGDLNPETGEGELLFEDTDGAAEPINAELLRWYLERQRGQMQLVTLNACLGALPVGDDPFSSVGLALIRSGVPAVVAMQFEITEDTAAELTRVLYAELAAGTPIDRALSEARLHIFGRYRTRLDWAIPVLFSRTETGELFTFPAPPPNLISQVKQPDTPVPSAPPFDQAVLRRLRQEAMLAYYREHWELAEVLLSEVRAADPNDEDVQAKLNEIRQQWVRTCNDTKHGIHDPNGALLNKVTIKHGDSGRVTSITKVSKDVTVAEFAEIYKQEVRIPREHTITFHRPETPTPIVPEATLNIAGVRDGDTLIAVEGYAISHQRMSWMPMVVGGSIVVMVLLVILFASSGGRMYTFATHIPTLVAVPMRTTDVATDVATGVIIAAATEAATETTTTVSTLQSTMTPVPTSFSVVSTFTDVSARPAAETGVPTPTLSTDMTPVPTSFSVVSTFTDVPARPVAETGVPTPTLSADLLPELVEIPTGLFLMGSNDNEPDADIDEQPQHELFLPPYWIGRTEVTNAQFRPFVEGDGYTNPEYWTEAGWQWCQEHDIIHPRFWEDVKWNANEQPVVGISWFEAVAYARWLSIQTGHLYRLPSEAEWEKAARGSAGLLYPWGNDWQPGWANTEEADIAQTTSVGSYPHGASPYGVLDMAGNVWEWCATKGHKDYPYKRDDTWSELYLAGDDPRMLRGGSWAIGLHAARGANRYDEPLSPDSRNFSDLGMRITSDSAPPTSEPITP
jgi:formylglycine-generating enzyme required for sulfatase activity